jgi:secreted trypsin-like serine protease
MVDFSAIQTTVEELRSQLDKLENQIGELEAQAVAAVRRAGFQSEPGQQGIIPPSKTQEGVQPIIGGEETSDFPDCCAVGDASDFFCTGTLIAPTVVVTARHCTGSARVFFGTNVANLGAGQVINVARHFSHPKADIQVLVLERAPSGIQARHIAQGAEVGGATCTLVGFGNTEATGRFGYGKKRKVEKIPIQSLACAGANDVSTFGCRKRTEMVAGQKGLRKDSCTGDSGGPLYIKQNGSIFLLGATSRGIQNAQNECGDGGIYVRVDQFIDWIKEKTGVNIPGPEL